MTPTIASSTPAVASTMISSVASSSDVTVTTTNGSTTSTTTVHAPYGIKSIVVNDNGTTYASTTPLTADDLAQMQTQQKAFEQHMNELFQQQEKLFNEQQKMFHAMWSGM